jgi:oligopeptide/dipeptide ABC transporter ATP-binding protein
MLMPEGVCPKEKLLDVQGLNIRFREKTGYVTAVNDMDFCVYKGEVLALVGESGCGKTVISLAVMGLLEPPGEAKAKGIILDGQDIAKASPEQIRRMRGARMAMIFQDPLSSLNPLFTVGNQISEQILTHEPGLRKKEAREKSVEMLAKTRIPRPEAIYHNYPHELSGGMRQRVMIAIALACKPKLLIADEPTTALDVTIQAQILRLMLDLVQEFGASILFITHDLGIVAEIADRVMVMYTGQIVEEAAASHLFHQPGHPYTQGLLRSTINVKEAGGLLAPIPGTVPSLNRMPSGCPFHPRCGEALACCENAQPDLFAVGDGHLVRCIHAKEG